MPELYPTAFPFPPRSDTWRGALERERRPGSWDRVWRCEHQHATRVEATDCARKSSRCLTCGDGDHSTAEHSSPLDAIPDDFRSESSNQQEDSDA